MLKPMIKSVLGRLGYNVGSQAGGTSHGLPYHLHSYRKADGSFDYARYRQVQTEGNKEKLENVWVLEKNIAFLSRYIMETIGKPSFGICHGTRRGLEQQWFRDHLGCEVIGAEISDTATQFPHTIQWDFHEVKPEWLDATDFIYSNAFDHSFDPERCLSAWMSCLRPGGLCILEHSSAHEPGGTSELDPFGADLAIMLYLITTWGNGKYGVQKTLSAPRKSAGLNHLHFIVIRRF